MYLLVEFTDSKEVAIIPDNWLDGTSCAVWPSHIRMTSKLTGAVKQKCTPGKNWPAFPIKEMYRNESYSLARSKLKKAENESDIGTTALSDDSDDSGQCRRSKRRRRLSPGPSVQQPMQRQKTYSSDEDEDIYPEENNSDLVHHEASPEVRNKVPKAPKPLSPPSGGIFRKSAPSIPQRLYESSNDNTSRDEPRSQSPFIRLGNPLSTPISQGTPKSQPSTSGTSVARDIRIFTLLEKLEQRQGRMEETLNKVLGVVQCLSSVSTTEQIGLPDDVKLPVSSQEEMVSLDQQLQDEAVFKALVHHLSIVGGINRSDTCRRALKTCLAHEIALTYNWYGKNGKHAFGKLRLAVAVQKAVVRSCRCTAAEVERDCREWFRTAIDREGGRKKGQTRGLLKTLKIFHHKMATNT